MSFWFRKILVATTGKGLFEATEDIQAIAKEIACENGVLVILCPHTTASVFLQERNDPTTKADLKAYISRLPEVLDILPKHMNRVSASC